jgi:hypothetical protein
VVLGVVVNAAFMIGTAPASVVAYLLAAATNSAVLLEGARGSAWTGRADAIVIRHPSIGTHHYERFGWQLSAGRLLVGDVAVRLWIDDRNLHGSATVSIRQREIHLRDATVQVPAASLAAYRPALSRAGLSGNVIVQAEELAFGEDGLDGAATISWLNAASTMSSMGPLGDYQALVRSANKHAEIQLGTINGVLQLDGRGTWSPSQGLLIHATAHTAEGNDRENIRMMLRLLEPHLTITRHRVVNPT